MKFTRTRLEGVWLIELDPRGDERGSFVRTYCEKEFAARGFDSRFVQCNVSYNRRAGTLRGMHYQIEPHSEGKLVRCTMGSIFDVIIDLRTDSPSYLKWFAEDLSAENRTALFIPRGFAHGFQTLVDNSEVLYQMTEFFHLGSARGIRWDDPLLAIRWPLGNPIVSDKDGAYALLDKAGP